MAAALEELINNIQEMVQEAWTLPLASDKCVIERERMLDLIDELRSTLPADIKMAAEIVQQKNQMMAEGRRELDSMKKRLEEEARKMLSKTENHAAGACPSQGNRGQCRNSSKRAASCSQRIL